MIEIRTLGRTSVAVNREPLTGEASWPKSLALIVYMAREPGPDRREEILGVLWPDREEKRARRALNQLLYTLRKASPELDLESVSDALDFGKEVWLDVEEFERRLEVGDLEGAVGLYGGHFLEDLSVGEPEFDHWADRQRADLRRKFRKAALELANGAKQHGHLDSAVAYCRRLVESDSLDDEAQHLFIECLYLWGDRLAALRQYDRYREVLQRELDVEPLEHTRELVTRIRGEPARGEAVSAEPETLGAPAPASGVVVEPSSADEAAPPPPPAPEPDRDPTLRKRAVGRPAIVAFALVAISAVILIVMWPRLFSSDTSTSPVTESALNGHRIAVLPFDLHGVNPEDVGLSTGVAQLLALNLANAGQLEVVDYHSVMESWAAVGLTESAAPDSASLAALSARLGARTLVMGDLHGSGREIRLVVETVDVRGGDRLRGADIRGPRDSLFGMLDGVAASLAAELERPAKVGQDSTARP